MAVKRGKHVANTFWTQDDRLRATCVFKSVSSIAKTHQITGIPLSTLEGWQRTEWWKEMLLALRAEDTAELEEAATSIAKQAGVIVQERLANGDHVLNKDGEIIRKPVSARDAAIIGAVSIDKRKVLQEEPVRGEQLGTAERLLKLVEQFTKFASTKEIKGVLNVEPPPSIFNKPEEIIIEDAKLEELSTELQAGSESGDQGAAGAEVRS